MTKEKPNQVEREGKEMSSLEKDLILLLRGPNIDEDSEEFKNYKAGMESNHSIPFESEILKDYYRLYTLFSTLVKYLPIRDKDVHRHISIAFNTSLEMLDSDAFQRGFSKGYSCGARLSEEDKRIIFPKQ